MEETNEQNVQNVQNVQNELQNVQNEPKVSEFHEIMYNELFNAITDADRQIECVMELLKSTSRLLKSAQCKTEEIFISKDDAE